MAAGQISSVELWVVVSAREEWADEGRECKWDRAPSWVGIEQSPSRQVRKPAQRMNLIQYYRDIATIVEV